jgi:hypothetical protein
MVTVEKGTQQRKPACISAFSNKDQPPTAEEVLALVGAKLSLWEELTAFISESYGIEGVLRYYGKSYGWQIWYQKSKKTLVALYPQKDGFVVQIVLGPSIVDKAFQLPLGATVRGKLEAAQQYPEGRWLFIEVHSKEDIADIKKLLVLKWPP